MQEERREGETDLTWQLREARAALAARVKAQQASDGFEEQPWLIKARLERDRLSGETREENEVEDMLQRGPRVKGGSGESSTELPGTFKVENSPDDVNSPSTPSPAYSAPLKPTPTTPLSSTSSAAPPVDERPQTAPSNEIPEPATDAREDRTCRICLDGDEDPELGTLFSPCKCRGTVRSYIRCAKSFPHLVLWCIGEVCARRLSGSVEDY